MRTITTICMGFLLFAAIANARLGDDSAATDFATAAVPVTAEVAMDVPSTADVNKFLASLWDVIGLGREYEDFSACVKQDDAGTQLQKAITLMNSSSAVDVINGLNKLGKVVTPLIQGLKDCKLKDKYTATINKVIKRFTNPSKINVESGVSITINNIDVYSDISEAVAACNIGDYDNCGTQIGEAMGQVTFGNETTSSAAQAAEINATPNITWVAAESTEFKGVNLWQFKKKRIGVRRRKGDETAAEDSEIDTKRGLQTIPAAFDSRTNWGTCIHPIRNQGSCGSCWAFAASDVLSDRFCIASSRATNTVMSPQYLVSCDSGQYACNGGFLASSWKFLERTGIVSETCFPYTSGARGVVPSCSTFTKCADKTTMRKFYAKTNSTKFLGSPAAIQAEILKNGPVESGMEVYSDFMSYKSGVYAKTASATFLGGHAIKIVGWGKQGTVNYWIVANSWGTYWGESGYFRIAFGNCNIDTSGYAALPDLTRK